MKGLIRKAALVLGCAAGAAGIGCNTVPTSTSPTCTTCGCGGAADGLGATMYSYLTKAPAPTPTAQEMTGCSNCGLYDRCYPERYNDLAHREVNLAFTPQVQNGHVLDQTVWNHYFEPGTDKLTPGGAYELQRLSRRRPQPDCNVYLATSLDLPYDPNCPDRYCAARQELDSLRVASVQKYLVGLNCGRPVDFQVVVHDPRDVTISSIAAGTEVLQMYSRFRGGLGGAGGAGGAAGPSGGGTATAGGVGGR